MALRRQWVNTALAGLLAIVTTTSLAGAQASEDATRSAARALGYEGIELLQNGHALEATERLERAYQVLKVPTIGLWSARALVASGKLVEASERYLEISRLVPRGDAAVQEAAKADAAREQEQLSARIPALVIRVEGPTRESASVLLDGVEVPRALLGVKRPVNPGKHQVRAGDVTREVSLREGQVLEVSLSPRAAATPAEPGSAPSAAPAGGTEQPAPTTPTPAPAETGAQPGSKQRLAGWILVGVGGAGLVAGGVIAGLAASKKDSLSGDCPDNACYPNAYGDADTYNTMRYASTAGFVVGAVGAVAGVTLLLTAPRAATALELRGGLASLRLKGSF